MTPIVLRRGTSPVEDDFPRLLLRKELATESTAFEGRSDYGPFIAVGIPGGGLFSGAEGHKTPEQVATYGGIADEQYDPCYHEACDTFAGTGDGGGATPPGLGLVSLDELSDGMAHAVFSLATTTSAVPATDSRRSRRRKAQPGWTSGRPRARR